MKFDVSRLSYAEISRAVCRLPFSVEKISLAGSRVLLEFEQAPIRPRRPAPIAAIAAMEYC
ncbi:MAG: hypothetical protein WC792_02175 [Candidatus Micrarchaeia archaeon]